MECGHTGGLGGLSGYIGHFWDVQLSALLFFYAFTTAERIY